jgi:hypothetical protein
MLFIAITLLLINGITQAGNGPADQGTVENQNQYRSMEQDRFAEQERARLRSEDNPGEVRKREKLRYEHRDRKMPHTRQGKR